MQYGYCALVDALGFKGLWKHADAAFILSTMRTVEQKIVAAGNWMTEFGQYNYKNRGHQGINLTLVFLSDTLLVGVSFPDADRPDDLGPVDRGYMWHAIRLALSTLVSVWSRSTVPLAFRGCITAGEFLADGAYIMRPAVDAAASLHEKADGAFIFLHPDAEEEFMKVDYYSHGRADGHREGMVRYPVPLKDEPQAKEMWVLELTGIEIQLDHKPLNPKDPGESLMKAFERGKDDPGVVRKRDHTADFIRWARNEHTWVFNQHLSADPRDTISFAGA